MAYECEVDECNRYSDVDVYFNDGTSEARCSEHAWAISDNEDVIQCVPQHGSDKVNQPIKE